MRLTSSAFADGGVIPRRFACDGEDVSPPLAWTDVPSAARSLVLLCDDPDAPAGTLASLGDLRCSDRSNRTSGRRGRQCRRHGVQTGAQ